MTAAPPYVAPVAAEPYRPLRGLATALKWLFLALIVADVVAIAFDLLEYRLYSRFEPAGALPAGEGDFETIGSGLAGVLQFFLFVAIAVLFIMWTHRAYKNLRVLGVPELRFRPGWAIGGWFVPIMNLWRPKQIVNDIWRGSDPNAAEQQAPSWRERGVPSLYALWWAAWIVDQTVSNGALRALVRADEISELKTAALVYAVADSLDIVAALLALLVVARTTDRQEARAARLAAPPAQSL